MKKMTLEEHQKIVKWLGIILVFGGILISVLTVRTIVKPVKKLKYSIMRIFVCF